MIQSNEHCSWWDISLPKGSKADLYVLGAHTSPN